MMWDCSKGESFVAVPFWNEVIEHIYLINGMLDKAVLHTV